MDLAFGEVHLLDTSRASIALNEFDVLNSLGHELGDEVVPLENQSLEHPRSQDWATEFLGERNCSHDPRWK